MTDAEFRSWLDAEVRSGTMTEEQQDDLLAQKSYFDLDRTEIERLYPHRVVGYVNGKREVGATVQELLAKTQKHYPGHMIYFEPIGFELF